MRKRTNQIIVRLNDEEIALLRRKLKANGMTMTGYFRTLIADGEIKIVSAEVMQDNVFHWNTWLSIAAVCPQSYRAFSFRRVSG